MGDNVALVPGVLSDLRQRVSQRPAHNRGAKLLFAGQIEFFNRPFCPDEGNAAADDNALFQSRAGC